MPWREMLRNTWGKLLVVLLPLAIVAGVALIRTQERVSQLEQVAKNHVTRAEVNAQLEAILRELAALREDVRDLRRFR